MNIWMFFRVFQQQMIKVRVKIVLLWEEGTLLPIYREIFENIKLLVY